MAKQKDKNKKPLKRVVNPKITHPAPDDSFAANSEISVTVTTSETGKNLPHELVVIDAEGQYVAWHPQYMAKLEVTDIKVQVPPKGGANKFFLEFGLQPDPTLPDVAVEEFRHRIRLNIL